VAVKSRQKKDEEAAPKRNVRRKRRNWSRVKKNPGVGTHQDDYMGITEIADYIGYSKQRVSQFVEQNDFPRPLAVLGQGRIWATESIDEWVDANFEEDDESEDEE
jgi:prophage regulatory protein